MSAKNHVKRFEATLGTVAGPLFVAVPFDVKAEFGRARAPVKVSVNGLAYRSTISVYGGRYYLPVRNDRRAVLGVEGGDRVTVCLEADTDTRTVDVPPDLARALAEDAVARERWATLGYSRQKAHAESVAGAKRPGTRTRRLERTLKSLRAAR